MGADEMPNFSLRRASDGDEWSEPATDKSEALEKFGAKLNKRLTFEDQGRPHDYSMAEREGAKEPTSPDWVFPVWEKS